MRPTAIMLLCPVLLATAAAAASAQYVKIPQAPSEPRWSTADKHVIESRTGNSSVWPYGPFSTEGRNIVNTRGDTITWAGVNWPLNLETMIPEGLEWVSVEQIIDNVASVGFNFMRMGYAIEMVDQIYERDGEDVPLEVAMIQALGYVNGTRIINEIMANNPTWTRETTRFEIWSDIARIAAEKGVFVHPDVHVGKAEWCCSHVDGNAWFDDLTFNTTNWLRGLSYVATWAKQHPNIVSMSLRNELRESWNNTDLYYNWQTLVGNMTAGCDAIHQANPDILITWSGMQYDEDLSALTTKKNILTAPCYKCTAIVDAYRRDPVYFDLDSHAWADKLVWELHLYSSSEDVDTGTCPIIEAGLYRNGFNALGIDPPAACNITNDCSPAQRITPVILTEFGHNQDPTMYNDTLQSCLKNYTEKNGVSWAMWSLAGSYRIRSGQQGLEDTWGLTSYNWSGWHFPAGIEDYWKPWVEAMNVTKLA